MESSFPIYILRLGDDLKVVFPSGQVDIPHIEFWEQTVADLVAAYYHIPVQSLRFLPYSQRRARIYENRIYYGEEPERTLHAAIRQALQNDQLDFFSDDHERRLFSDVLQFEALLQEA